MYKNLFIAAAAVAVLASCTKNEVNPVSVPEQEISYQAVVGPKTKGDLTEDKSKFSTGNVFKSYAYILEDNKVWPTNADEASPYINGAVISYVQGVWKSNNNPYFWPKNEGASLTFFAWSTNSGTVELSAGSVSCDPDNLKGITVSGYDSKTNKNVDFMVADVAFNKKNNGTVPTYEKVGVPTLFHHELCQVKYKINLNHAYTAVEFHLKSLKFNGISQKADYTQRQTTGSWHNWGTGEPFTYLSSEVNPDVKLSYYENVNDAYPTDAKVAEYEDQYYFIPQPLTEATMTINYEIITKTGSGDETTKQDVVKSVSLKSAELFPNGWEKNKIYTINITLGLDEILWDPAVQDWEEEDKNWSLID